jgi:DNA topoisomerase-3
MTQGDAVTAVGSEVTAKTTPKPPEFTDGTLITAMVNAHRFEINPELKKRLKEGDGIGTEATRAATIQKLLGVNKDGKVLVKNPMLSRKGKDKLVSTEFGRSVIDMLPEELRSLGMTALWEGLLSQVEKGVVEPEAFLDRQAKSITERIEKSKGTKVALKGVVSGVRPMKGHGEPCPRCSEGVMMTREIFSGDNKGKKFLGCSRHPDCRFSCNGDVDPIPGHGKTCPVCKTGKMWTTEITSKKDGKKYKFLKCVTADCEGKEWPERAERPAVAPIAGDGKACTKCGTGIMDTKSFTAKSGVNYTVLSCRNYPACSNTEWPERSAVKAMPGDGQTCKTCGKGTMRTKEYTDKKDGKKKQFLSCSDSPTCKGVVWPDDGKAGYKTAETRPTKK